MKEEKHRKEAYATLDKIFGEFSEGTGSMEHIWMSRAGSLSTLPAMRY